MPYKNKEDQKISWNKWRQKNKEKDNERIRERQKTIRIWFQEYKKKLSCPCGENHPGCIDFHHKIKIKKILYLS